MRSRSFFAFQRGFSLIELMVAVTISLLVSIAIFTVMTSSESKKRSTTSVNDIQQSGNYAMYVVDKIIRSAGSGFGQSWQFSYGCQLTAARSSTQVLPMAAVPPAPFASVNTGTSKMFRLAPVMIAPGQTTPNMANVVSTGHTSDVLVVMSGSAGYGEIPTVFTNFATASQLNLINTVAFTANDVLLIADQNSGTTVQPCIIEQVTSTATGLGTATALPLGGLYYQNPIGTLNLTSFSTNAIAMNIGDMGTASPAPNPPNFQLIGVGDNDTLFSYDLLQTNGETNAVPVADGVFEMHAIYGVDNSPSPSAGTITAWSDASTSPYDLATLNAGTAAAASRICRIKAIKIGFILRTSLPEKNDVSSALPNLFSDMGALAIAGRTLSGADKKYRYRAIESTIPLRNALLTNGC